MFERIAVERTWCGFCGDYGMVAILTGSDPKQTLEAPACERCIRAAVKAADLLKTLRQAKAQPPKKGRKGPQSRATGPLPHPRPQDTSSLVPGTTV